VKRPSSIERDRLRLRDITDATKSLQKFLKDVSFEQFRSNEMLQSAVLYKLAVIGEAAANLTPELREENAQLPWKDYILFRNTAIHAYFSVDLEAAFETAANDLIEFQSEIEALYKTTTNKLRAKKAPVPTTKDS
jgi:uncharacterized protein with HEPN domain